MRGGRWRGRSHGLGRHIHGERYAEGRTVVAVAGSRTGTDITTDVIGELPFLGR